MLGGAAAEERVGPYFALRGYASVADQNNFVFDDGKQVAAALGWRAFDLVRIEAEYAYRASKIVGLNGGLDITGEYDSQTLGGHLYFDLYKDRHLRPYVGGGGGVGLLRFRFNGVSEANPAFEIVGDDRDENFYWNTFAGVSWRVNSRLRLSVGAEYVSYFEQDVASNIGGIPGINRAYNLYAGTRWKLGR